MKLLSPNDIKFHPTSFCDGHGRLFFSGGELYRGIPEKRAQFTRDLFARAVVEELEAKRFIPRTELTEDSLGGYPIVLHHERIPFVSYAFEWSPGMLRDAALFDLRYLRLLARHQLSLAGVAAWNILFVGSEPRAVDFCDITAAPEDQEAHWGVLDAQFRSYYLRPLELMARGQGNLARFLQTDYEHGPIQNEFEAATAVPMTNTWRRGAHAIRRRTRALDGSRKRQIGEPESYFAKKLDETEKRFAGFHFPIKRMANNASPQVRERLENDSSKSVLVIGGSDNTIAQCRRNGAAVVAIDRDPERVDAIYEWTRAERANVLPLVVDLRYPAPGYGVQNTVLAPALSRLRCDLVVSLGLIESLVFRQRLRFEQIAGTLGQLTVRRLLIDFPSARNPEVVAHLRDPYFSWFGLDRFVHSLQHHFASVRVEPPADDAATVLICEKASDEKGS